MKNYHIFLVDNEIRLVECLKLVLNIEGHSVTSAGNGEEALDKLKEIYADGSKVDLLITDILMPKMSGIELIDKLHQCDISPATLGISGLAENETIAKLAEKGCTDLILKPFTSETLLQKITEIMNRNY